MLYIVFLISLQKTLSGILSAISEPLESKTCVILYFDQLILLWATTQFAHLMTRAFGSSQRIH